MSFKMAPIPNIWLLFKTPTNVTFHSGSVELASTLL